MVRTVCMFVFFQLEKSLIHNTCYKQACSDPWMLLELQTILHQNLMEATQEKKQRSSA